MLLSSVSKHMGVILQDLEKMTWASLFICLSIFLWVFIFIKTFPLHKLDEVVDNTNIFGFLRALFHLQHMANFGTNNISISKTGVNLQGQCCDGSRG